MRTATALYDRHEDAIAAIRELEASGFNHTDLSLFAPHTEAGHHAGLGGSGELYRDSTGAGTSDVSGPGAGAAIGGIMGGGAGLLASLGVMTIPGIGQAVAAGWLVATLAGAAAGAVGGGLIGALVEAGASEEEAHVYGEGVRRGGTLVAVRVPDERYAEASTILHAHGSVDIVARGVDYRESGWQKLDEGSSSPAVRKNQRTRLR